MLVFYAVLASSAQRDFVDYTSSKVCLSDAPSSAAEISKPGASQPPLPENSAKDTLDRLDKLRHSSGSLSTAQIRGKMQRAMQADAAVFRTQVA